MESKFYSNVKIRTIKEIEEEILNQKTMVIANGLSTEEGRRANDRIIWLEWTLGVRDFK